MNVINHQYSCILLVAVVVCFRQPWMQEHNEDKCYSIGKKYKQKVLIYFIIIILIS